MICQSQPVNTAGIRPDAGTARMDIIMPDMFDVMGCNNGTCPICFGPEGEDD